MTSPLNELLPEIFPIIASHLPLHATPSTLLALALTNHHIYGIVLPLVYLRLILKNEADALKVLQKLLAEPELGKLVRELHIMSHLSLATRNGENPFDAVKGLEKVIAAGSLSFIHTLGLHLLDGWYYDDEGRVEGFCQLKFWSSLRANCPRLRGLVLRNIRDREDDRWVDNSGLLEIQDITSLTLNFIQFSLTRQCCEKLLKNIASLSSSFHTLNLNVEPDDWISLSPFFASNFPRLRSLSLDAFKIEDTYEAMSFWRRHPTLEYLKIITLEKKTRWFTSDLSPGLLPNLKHLKAHFNDVRILAPILHQLVGLTVFESLNAQVPYLIRQVLPEGLPNLRSLNIEQDPSRSGKNVNIEGSLWYETADGEFLEFRKKDFQKGYRTVFDSYMHSIARGAPNLEEIGFHKDFSKLSDFANIASEIAGLSHLRRLYQTGYNASISRMTEEDRDAFVADARVLAEECKNLTSVTDVSNSYLPYVTARIFRNGEGSIKNIELGTGYGLQIGSDDEAFPHGQAC